MEYFHLPESEHPVSRIGFGCEQLGGTDWGRFDRHQTFRAIRSALNHGITFFDTANVYGLGESESALAKCLGSERHRVIIATKGGYTWSTSGSGVRARTHVDLRERNLRRSVFESLRRLKLECIPLYFLHRPDGVTPLAESVGVLQELREEGLIAHIGLSNFSPEQVRIARRYAPIAAVQIQYNILHRDEFERLAELNDGRIKVFGYGILAQGLLTGKYNAQSTFDVSDRRHRLETFRPDRIEENLRTVEKLRAIAEQRGCSPTQVAIRWALQNTHLNCAILGCKSVEQIEEQVGSIGWCLDATQYKFLTD